MANSVGGAIAEGIQGGWQMGQQADAAREHRREFDREQASREDAQARLRKQEDDRYGRLNDQARMQAVESRLTWLQKLSDDTAKGGHAPSEELLNERAKLSAQLADMQQQVATTGRLASGVSGAAPAPQPAAPAPGPVAAAAQAPQPTAAPAPPPAMAGGAPATAAVASPTSSAVTPAQKLVADTDQRSQDLASRLGTGQISLNDVDPKDFALMVASATKRPPGELDQVRQHIADWQSGMATKNDGLTLQGLNGVFGPMISQGVGSPSAHGGMITGKSIIGLDPAMSADGSTHTDKVIPRLQITTDAMGANGQPLTYHAPMTQNRSTDPGDPVAAVPMAGAVNHIGALSTLVESMSHPDAAAKLAAGASNPAIAMYLDAFRNASAPADPVAQRESIVQKYQKVWGTDRDATIERLQELDYLKRPPQAKGVAATMEAAYQAVQDGTYPDVPTALKAMQAAGLTRQPTKYSPGAIGAAPSGTGSAGRTSSAGEGTGMASAPSSAPDATGDEYLKALPRAMQDRVKNIAANPSLLQNVPVTKGQRAAMADAVLRYDPSAKLGKDAGGLQGREGIYVNRIVMAGNQAAHDLENVVRLPMSSDTGWFGGAHGGTSLMTAPLSVLANKMTPQDVQSYNVRATGFHRSLAAIEAAGLAPSGSLVNQMDSIILKNGDTQLSRLEKLAQTRQIIESGMESTLSNPKLPGMQRDHIETILNRLHKAVPYTIEDIDNLKLRATDGDPKATLAGVINSSGLAKPAAPKSAAPTWTDKDEARLRELEAKHGAH